MPDGYRIELTPAAERDLARLPPDTRRRVSRHIDDLAQNPRPAGVRALEGRAHYLRLRIGDYRIVYAIDDPRRTVVLALIAHRREVYRRLRDR